MACMCAGMFYTANAIELALDSFIKLAQCLSKKSKTYLMAPY